MIKESTHFACLKESRPLVWSVTLTRETKRFPIKLNSIQALGDLGEIIASPSALGIACLPESLLNSVENKPREA